MAEDSEKTQTDPESLRGMFGPGIESGGVKVKPTKGGTAVVDFNYTDNRGNPIQGSQTVEGEDAAFLVGLQEETEARKKRK